VTPATPATPATSLRASRAYLATVTLFILGVAALCEVRAWAAAETPQLVYSGMLVVDRWSIFLGALFCLSGGLSVMLAGGFLREHRFEYGEFYALALFSTAGMLILAHAANLVSLLLGVETMSLAVYVLTGSWRHSARSSEAAMKYFLVGSFASAVMIYGIALIYGATGTSSLLDLASIGHGRVPVSVMRDPVFLVGGFFLLAGLAFKVAAVPFHMWLPDAYEGAPTPVTAFMASGVKAAGFAALVRVVGTAFVRPELTFGVGGWASLAAVLAIVTMSLGNLAAIRQDNVKRMLAYSSIAHAGYILVGVATMGPAGAEARGPILYYLAAYSFTTIGSFGVVAWYGSQGDERQHLDDWAGLGARHPAAALAMTVFLLSLGGIPPTAGFFAKFYIFRVALTRPGLAPLVIVAVANSLVSVFYYLRVVSTMYFREVGREPTPLRSPGTAAALLLSAVGTLALGLVPGWLVELAAQATMYLPK
jgi:NADH-quinone oxidoreductase subunit N